MEIIRGIFSHGKTQPGKDNEKIDLKFRPTSQITSKPPKSWTLSEEQMKKYLQRAQPCKAIIKDIHPEGALANNECLQIYQHHSPAGKNLIHAEICKALLHPRTNKYKASCDSYIYYENIYIKFDKSTTKFDKQSTKVAKR